MVQITPKAEEVLKQYFQDKEVSPIRIFLQQGG
jgi:Fe-S cluster assembly iron-binding protein IscA